MFGLAGTLTEEEQAILKSHREQRAAAEDPKALALDALDRLSAQKAKAEGVTFAKAQSDLLASDETAQALYNVARRPEAVIEKSAFAAQVNAIGR